MFAFIIGLVIGVVFSEGIRRIVKTVKKKAEEKLNNITE
jgi:hypothetical protein